LLLSLLMTAALEVERSRAATVTLMPIADTSIYSDQPSNSNGGGPEFYAGNNARGQPRRALMRFDVAGSVPAGATINSASLQLFLATTASGPSNVSLSRVTSSWGEGKSSGQGDGAPATGGDATWVFRAYNTTFWGVAGGDFASTVSASTMVNAAGQPYTFASTPKLVSDVQGWLSAPAGNFGWILIGNESATKIAKGFASRENTIASRRPALTITYTPVPEPSAGIVVAAACAAGSIGLRRRKRQRRRYTSWPARPATTAIVARSSEGSSGLGTWAT
jgi:hypothetical protein